MKNQYMQLLKSTSNVKIAFLKDVKSTIHFNKKGKFYYHYIPNMDFACIQQFILNLDTNFYTVIPMLSINARSGDPHIILSKQILLTPYSNPKIFSEYLENQLEIVINDFEFGALDKFHYLIFKYKKVNLEI
jgi:hypothetical protein